MLFDLQGRRKNVIRVIYACLALLMGGGLVLLGIGGDASGGLLNAVGLGDDETSTSADPALERQIDNAEATLASDPEDERALLTLARAQFLSANNQLETDEQGATVLTEEAIADYAAAADAWERYLATNPKEPDDGVAIVMVRAYANLAGTGTAAELEEQLAGAVEAARIVAEARPSVGTYTTLATYAYLAGDTKLAAQAEKDALADASDSTTKQQVQQQIAAAKAQGKAIAQGIKENAPDEEQLNDPLSGFGSTGAPPPGG